jgi:hypothetical protein
MLEDLAKSADRIAADSGKADGVFPPCWLRELSLPDHLARHVAEGFPVRRQHRTAWHSWLTDLYPYDVVRQDFWYPDGPLREGLRAVEVRDRAQ